MCTVEFNRISVPGKSAKDMAEANQCDRKEASGHFELENKQNKSTVRMYSATRPYIVRCTDSIIVNVV